MKIKKRQGATPKKARVRAKRATAQVAAEKVGWETIFLETFAVRGNVSESCKKAGVHRATVYEHRKADKEFARQFRYARAEASDALEAEARRRAVEGTEEPVFDKGGKLAGHVMRYSDTLLIVLLKANRPKKFRDNWKGEISGPNGGAISVTVESLIERVYGDDNRATDARQ